MSEMDVDKAVVGTSSSLGYTDPTKTTDFYTGTLIDSDGVRVSGSSWMCDWAKWHGYYMDVPIFAAIIDTTASWAVGRGYKTDEKTQVILNRIKGWGKDDFNSIIENQTRVTLCGGDSHAEVVEDKAGRLTNLKPLNPGTMKQIVNGSGILTGYEQTINGKVIGDPFAVKKIFHLCWNRLADEIHGKGMAERAEPIIKQIKQLQDDLGIRFHRIVKPLRFFEAATDNTTKLTATEVKLKNAYQKCEIIVIPKGTLAPVPAETIPNADDCLKYLDHLTRNLVTACNVPEIIMGWGTNNTTDASKIVYLAFQQKIERIQKFLEEQIRLQLGITLNFEFPASLEPALTSAGGNIRESPKVTTPKESLQKDTKLNLKAVDATKDQK